MGDEPSSDFPLLSAAVGRSDLNFKGAPYGVLQLGEGRFLRGFSVPLFQHLSLHLKRPFKVLMVNNRMSGLSVIRGLQRQDGMYTLVTQSDRGGPHFDVMWNVVPKSVAEDWDEVVSCICDPHLTVVVTNATEAGVIPPTEAGWPKAPGDGLVSRLVLLLWERWQLLPHRALTVLPTELVSHNGRRLQTLVVRAAGEWHAPESFIRWLSVPGRFVNTVVDRIVTGMPPDPDRYWRALGYRDDFLTLGEAYARWWIEGSPEELEHLAITSLPEVQLVRDIRPYEALKVYGLNGAHVAIAAVGLREGWETVADALEDQRILSMVESYWNVMGPLVALPSHEVEAFIALTRRRFSQRWLPHRLQDIATNLPGKWRQRIEPLMDEVWKAHGRLLPPLPEISLAVAAWAAPDAAVGSSRDQELESTLLGSGTAYPSWWSSLLEEML